MAESPPPVSIVIPTWRRPRTLGRVLRALERQRGVAGAFEALIVADAREDAQTVDAAIGTRSFPVRRLQATAPGAAPARNLGWRAAAAPIVLFLDDDAVPAPRLVAEHLAVHRAHPELEVGALGRVAWARAARPTAFMRWLDHGVLFDYARLVAGEVGWGRFYTANASVKRTLLERVGGFDEGFPFLYEDTELARRMADHGFRLVYNPRARAAHRHHVTLDQYRARMAAVAAAERRFVARHPDVAPYFHDLFSAAAAAPPARGRGARLAGIVPPATPWLGPRVWASADARFRQALAPAFLSAWEAAGAPGGQASEAPAAGSPPAGPK